MDRRLSGALAWGALILIVGIPGAEMLGKRTPPAADTPAADATTTTHTDAALSWNSTKPRTDEDVLGPPVSAKGTLAETTPSVAASGNAGIGNEATNPSIVTLDPPAKPASVSDITPNAVVATPTSMPDVVSVPTAPATSASVPATTEPASPATAELASPPETVSPGAAGIAARVREIILSGESSPAPESAAAAPGNTVAPVAPLQTASVAPAETAAVAALPEVIPYPAPVSQRPRAPVVIAAAKQTQPAADIRPDNAIFFRNWSLVPPKPIGPGR